MKGLIEAGLTSTTGLAGGFSIFFTFTFFSFFPGLGSSPIIRSLRGRERERETEIGGEGERERGRQGGRGRDLALNDAVTSNTIMCYTLWACACMQCCCV